MELVIFIPVLVGIGGLLQWGAQKTFLKVCLPCLMLLPTYFYWKTHGGVDFGMASVMPAAVAMLGMLVTRWKVTRTDVWLAVYMFSTAYADYRAGMVGGASYTLFDNVFTTVVPYMAGKLLIESGARVETAKRLILAICVSCVGALPECVLKINLYMRGWMHFFPAQWPGWYTQIRWGLGRVAGPCGSPELYGIVLMTAMILLLWVRRREAKSKKFLLKGWASSKTTTLALFVLLMVTFILTESRGPWLGMLLGALVAWIGTTKNVRRTALIVALLCVAVAFPTYEAMNSYAGGPRKEYGSEQETAQYRREMMENYVPAAEAGGLWGWGTNRPVLNGQPSIDNEFLRVFLVQGYAGVLSYILLFLEAAYVVLRNGLAKETGEDKHFCFTMLGLLAGWALTLSTVYMGAQSYQLFFLVVGWTQAMPREVAVQREGAVAEMADVPALNRVFT